MALTTKESILKVLNAYNPWWKTGATNPSLTKTYKRFSIADNAKFCKRVTNVKRNCLGDFCVTVIT